MSSWRIRPFRSIKWGAENAENDKHKRFWRGGIPPKVQGDYAFISHMIEIAPAQLAEWRSSFAWRSLPWRQRGKIRKAYPGESARCRGRSARQSLHDHGIPVCHPCVRPLSRAGRRERGPQDILFIDASEEFAPGKTQNLMTEEHFRRSSTRIARAEIDKYSHLASPAEIQENDLQPQHSPLRRHLRTRRGDRRRRTPERNRPAGRRTRRSTRPHGRLPEGARHPCRTLN